MNHRLTSLENKVVELYTMVNDAKETEAITRHHRVMHKLSDSLARLIVKKFDATGAEVEGITEEISYLTKLIEILDYVHNIGAMPEL